MIQFQFYVKLNPSSKFCKHHSHDILYFKHNGIKKAFTMKDFFYKCQYRWLKYSIRHQKLTPEDEEMCA